MVHQNKAKFRKFPWKRVLGTAVRLTIFSNIQLIKKKFGSNIDGQQNWKNSPETMKPIALLFLKF